MSSLLVKVKDTLLSKVTRKGKNPSHSPLRYGRVSIATGPDIDYYPELDIISLYPGLLVKDLSYFKDLQTQTDRVETRRCKNK